MAERCVPKLGQKDPNEKSGNWHSVDSKGAFTEVHYTDLDSPVKIRLVGDVPSVGYEQSTITVRQRSPLSTEIHLKTNRDDTSYRFQINDISGGTTPHKEVKLDLISLPKGTQKGLGTEIIGNLLQTAWSMAKNDEHNMVIVNLEADIYYGSYVWLDSGFRVLGDEEQVMIWGDRGNLSTRTDLINITESYMTDVIANFPKQDMTPEEVQAEINKLREPFAPFDAFEKTGLSRYLKEGFNKLTEFVDEKKLIKEGYKEPIQIGETVEGIKYMDGLYKEGILAGLAFNARMEIPVDNEESLSMTPELEDFSKRFKRKTGNSFDVTGLYYED